MGHLLRNSSLFRPFWPILGPVSSFLSPALRGPVELLEVADAQALQAASNNVEDSLWIVPDASHSRGYKAMPEEYISRVVSFFDRAIAA